MISIKNVFKIFNRGKNNEVRAINGVSLELPDRGLVAIFGKSGCGKTTLLNAIGGLDDIASGEISVYGKNIREKTDDIRNEYIGYIFQNYNLSRDETVFENVANALRLCGMEEGEELAARVVSALEIVGMEKFKSRLPETLSGGQQQRVAIARAIVKNPAIILADEPTGNLDDANTVMIMELLKAISEEHLVLLVTHEESLVDLYCDRVIEIKDGAVASDRQNESTVGFEQKNRNDVYLGELEERLTELDGLVIEEFGGKSDTPVRIRLVHYNGKTYIQPLSENLQAVTAGCEVNFKEGVFEKRELTQSTSKHIDMSTLPPVSGKGFGRLYKVKNVLPRAFRSVFPKAHKRSNRLLRVLLLLMSFITVFMSATLAVNIKNYTDGSDKINENIMFIPAIDEVDYSAITDSVGSNGIQYAKVVPMHECYSHDGREFYFSLGNFMTSSAATTRGFAFSVDKAVMGNAELVAGSLDMKKEFDAVITTAMADELIENANANFIDGYDDLIGISSMSGYDVNYAFKITGIVKGDNNLIYLNRFAAAYSALSEIAPGVYPLSGTDYDGTLAEGEIAVFRTVYSDKFDESNKTLTVSGKSFKIADVVMLYSQPVEYKQYVEDVHGVKLLDFDSYYKTGEDRYQKYCEWMFDYYYEYLADFMAVLKDYKFFDETQNAFVATGAEWLLPDVTLYMGFSNSAAIFEFEDAYALYYGYKYKNEHGVYPTYDELSAVNVYNNEYTADYSQKIIEIYNSYGYSDPVKSANGYYIVSDADYIKLASAVGKSDVAMLYFNTYNNGNYGITASHYLMLYTDGSDAARAFVTEALAGKQFTLSSGKDFGTKYNVVDYILTSDDVSERLLEGNLAEIIASIIGIAVLLAIMCISVYFIMRSSLMSRVKEVGIMRAIGVSKRNVIFRFFIEALVLFSLTVLIGFAFAFGIIIWLTQNSLIATMLAMPLWLAIVLVAVVGGACLLFGLLPIAMLLRKTPRAILAKYDI